MVGLKIYRISQTVNQEDNTYDAAIVAAENEGEARRTLLSNRNTWPDEWANPSDVRVEEIGVANKDIKKGVILASFNAERE